MSYTIQQVGPTDIDTMHQLLSVFGEAFAEPETYGAGRPDEAYLRDLLDDRHFIALVAQHKAQVVGGLTL